MKYLKLVYLRKVYQFICEWIIDHCISPIFGLLPVKNTILLESSPDLSDSTKAVFDEMIRRKMNEKYKFVWYLHHNIVNPPQIKNVDYLCNKRGRLVFKYFEYTSICLISSNMFLGAHSKGQKAFYINHGSPFKSVKGYYSVPDNVDYLLAEEHLSSHGDDYLPLIQSWYDELTIGAEAPRDKKVILESFLTSFDHPAFCALHHQDEYVKLKKSIQRKAARYE